MNHGSVPIKSTREGHTDEEIKKDPRKNRNEMYLEIVQRVGDKIENRYIHLRHIKEVEKIY